MNISKINSKESVDLMKIKEKNDHYNKIINGTIETRHQKFKKLFRSVAPAITE